MIGGKASKGVKIMLITGLIFGLCSLSIFILICVYSIYLSYVWVGKRRPITSSPALTPAPISKTECQDCVKYVNVGNDPYEV
jgi:hypothetical protein